MTLRRQVDALKTVLSSRHVLWLVPLVVAGHLAFGLDLGWMIDDHVHRAALTRHPDLPEWHRAPEELFSFTDGDPAHLGRAVSHGTWPWWSASELHLAFWRPLTGWSHALDYRAWPDDPRLMHAQSLAWYLLAVVLLLMFYRRVLPRPAVAALAGLLYALDDSQTLPGLWLANRNAVLAVAFGAASLLAHDRWRRGGWRAGAVAGPLALLAAVLANEGAVAVGGYLLAYAIFLDPAPWPRRLAALLPSAGVGLAWAVAYKAGGYGAVGSGVYIDPMREPMRFAAAAVDHAPLLLWGWWGFPPADVATFLPETARFRVWLLAVALLALLAGLLRPVLRRDAVSRFLGLGMLLALLPACSTFPSNRLLGFVGIGAAGLLALLLEDLLIEDQASTSTAVARGRRWGRRAVLVTLVTVHLIAAPLLIRPIIGQIRQLDRMVRSTAASLVELTAGRAEPGPGPEAVLVVATPSAFVSLASTLVATLEHDWRAVPHLVLSSSIYQVEVRRTDAATLVIRPRGGFLRRPDSPHPRGVEDTSIGPDPRKALLLLDHLFRDVRRDTFRVGDSVALEGVTLEILEEEGGRPLAIACRFSEPLESPRWHWLSWREGRYERFPVPEVGGAVLWPGLYERI